WWLDVILDEDWQRIAVWAGSVVLMRYTYGLNIVELLMAFAAIVVIDAPRRFRIPLFAVSLVALFAAFRAHARFAVVVRQWGWFAGYDVVNALWAGQLALASLLLASLGLPKIARALRLPLMFSCASFTIAVYHLHTFKPSYYIYKYPLDAICLAALA